MVLSYHGFLAPIRTTHVELLLTIFFPRNNVLPKRSLHGQIPAASYPRTSLSVIIPRKNFFPHHSCYQKEHSSTPLVLPKGTLVHTTRATRKLVKTLSRPIDYNVPKELSRATLPSRASFFPQRKQIRTHACLYYEKRSHLFSTRVQA